MEFLKPFVLPVEARTPERHEFHDLYLPDDLATPRPAILVVPGGPLPAEVKPAQRDWPVFQGYALLAAGRGAIGAIVDHRLYSPEAYAEGASNVEAALETLRSDPRVDENRLALWFYSGSALFSADWFREPPSWLRAVALSYPLLAPFPGWPDLGARFDPIAAVAEAGELPIVLTRVGRENPFMAQAVETFVTAAAKANLEIVDVPDGQHTFDAKDDTDESREAISRGMELVLAQLA
ncbi:alpha/beta hydrolase [Actinoplanes sp. NPDC020271]|uniref:alpha/beta hydrolase n=1 Tax=Actinoplanes sp. NPDC020271 TaxID=3363896 RepID=UPI0037A51979